MQPLVGSLDTLAKLRPVTFEWRDPEHRGAGLQKGFIAQEVEKVLPEWVGVDEQGYRTLDKKGLDVMLVASVQTLKMENDSLKDRVRALEAGRPPLTSGLGGAAAGILGLGLGLGALGSRRRRSDAGA